MAKKIVEFSTEELKRLPLLALLDSSSLDQLISASRIQAYPKHHLVLVKGVINDWLGILIKGHLQVVDISVCGVEVGLNILVPGNFFGEITVIDRQPRSASLVALTPCVVLQIPGDIARQLFFGYPPVAEAMQIHFVSVMRRMNEFRSLWRCCITPVSV